jgi:hypothetical protein
VHLSPTFFSYLHESLNSSGVRPVDAEWYKGVMEVKKWQYSRDVVSGLDQLDTRLEHWGDLGWELVSMIHTTETASQANESENILAAEKWMLILKQPK